MKRVFIGPTVISPVVTRLRWPPLMPRIIWLPTMVSAHTCASGMICQVSYSVGKPGKVMNKRQIKF